MDKLFELGFPKERTYEPTNECCGELVECDGHMVCKNCFRMFKYLIDSKFEYNERQQPNIYIPSTYMKVRLYEFIGMIDKDVTHLLPLMKDAKTTHDIYNILKKNKLNTYYDAVYLIAKKIGVPCPHLTNEEIDRLIFLFNQVKIKLPYHFILEKLFIKIDRYDLVPFLHKTRNKNKYNQYQLKFETQGFELWSD